MKKAVRIILIILAWTLMGRGAAAQPAFTFDLPGNLTSESNIVTVALPGFQQTAQYLIAEANGPLSVSVPVTGAGPFTYQWELNGTAIGGATSDSYEISNTVAANLGSYQLIARNSAGAVTSAVVNVSFDTDQLGLPDAWQMEYFGHLGVDPNGDPNGSGVDNYEAYLDGTNPNIASSTMPRLNLFSTPGGTASVTPLKLKYQFNETVQITATPNPGNVFICWSGAITNSNTTVSVVMNGTQNITANFGLSLAEVLGTPNLVWTTGGDNRGWFGETNTTYDGVSAAQSGVSLVGQESWIQTTISSPYLLQVAFDWAVSSTDLNYLNFNINGTTATGISGGEGAINWFSQAICVPPGATTLNWNYTQSVADNDYGWIDLDTGWLDDVQLSPVIVTPGYSSVVAWGANSNNQAIVPPGLTNVVSIAGGEYHSLALRNNGTVVAWGNNTDGETNVPAAAVNVSQIAGGWLHSLALRRDGTVVAWGNNDSGQTNVPPGLSNVVAIAAGEAHSLALQSDGIVVAWGANDSGQTTVPANLTNVVAIAAGANFNVVLKADGTVVAWGDDESTQTNVPPGVNNVAAIAAGESFCLALQSDGTVTAWGSDDFEQNEIPYDLTNAVSIATGVGYSMALESDGTIVAWGDNTYCQTTAPSVPPQTGAFVAIAAGGYHGLALLNDGAPQIAQQPVDQVVYSGVTAIFNAGAAGVPTLDYQWRRDGTSINGATDALLSLVNVQTNSSGTYSVVVSNSLGSVTSASARLTVVNSAPIFTSQPTSVSVVPGQDAAFSAGAVGSLPMVYQWQFNGTNLPGENSTNLILSAIAASQAGSYRLVINNLYGSVTSAVVTLTVASTLSTVVFSTVHTFGSVQDAFGDALDGANPYAGLMQASNGNLYGTTTQGGSNSGGFGIIFQLTADGNLTTLYSFGAIQDTNGNALDGASPYSPLTQGTDGNLYGTTVLGGSNYSQGTVFRITTNGALTTLHEFGANSGTGGEPLDGEDPYGGLVLDPNGDLYGTTFVGGSNGAGTLYRITGNQTVTSIYSFGTRQDNEASNPYDSLVVGTDGGLYGTTSDGGSNGYGTVFRMTTNGAVTSLYSFGATLGTNATAKDGSNPYASVVQGTDGAFYGTTVSGGTNVSLFGSGYGTIFRITTNGTLTTLYSFGGVQDTNGYALDGANPQGGVVQGSDGGFYGATAYGGEGDFGTLYRITSNGVFTTLYRFSGGNDGANPYSGLIQAKSGVFYGTTSYGGTNGDGTIFSFTIGGTTPSPPPPVIESIAHSAGTVTFTWSSVAKLTYQVQYATNLNQTIWNNLGPSSVASGVTSSGSDTITSAERFYRIVLLP